MSSLDNEVYLSFIGFIKNLNYHFSGSGREPKISFDPMTAIYMTDVINSFSMIVSDMNAPKIDLFKGFTMMGVKLGVFMSQKELNDFENSFKASLADIKKEIINV